MARHARIAHHIPGRLRMTVGGARHDPGFLSRVASAIGDLAGVDSVSFSARTGSFVVHYRKDPNALVDALRDLGAALGLFDLSDETPRSMYAASGRAEVPGSDLGRALMLLIRFVDRELKLATEGKLDLRIVLPFGAAGFSAASGARNGSSAPTPLWLSLAIFAVHSFIALHHDVPLTAEAPRHALR